MKNGHTCGRKTAFSIYAILIACGMGLSHVVNAQGNGAGPLELDEVVVTGIRGSLQTALETKRNADSVVDGIAAQDIGEFPDQNVAESLQRIPGVTIDRRSGEGQRITVRGLGPDFNLVALNNRQLATVSGGRDFDFQVIASELIGAADVYKTPTADLTEGWMGGYVNLKTLRPLDNPGTLVTGTAMARFQDLGDESGPVLSGVFSTTNSDETLGFLFAASYTEITQRLDSTFSGNWGARTFDPDGAGPEAPIEMRAPNRAGFELVQEERDRLGVNLAFQIRPSDRLDMTFDALYVDFDRKQTRDYNTQIMQIGWTPDLITDLVVGPNGTLQRVTKLDAPLDEGGVISGGPIETTMLGWNGVFSVNDRFVIDADVAWSEATNKDEFFQLLPGMRTSCALDNAPAGCVDVNNNLTWVNGDIPSVVTTFDMTDPSLMRAHYNTRELFDRSDEIVDAKVNASLDVEWGAISSLQFGLARLDREFENSYFDNGGNDCFPIQAGSPWEPTGRGSACGRQLDLPDDVFVRVGASDLLDEASGPFPNFWLRPTSFADLCATLTTQTGNSEACDLFPNPTAGSFVEEQNTAAYLRANLDGELAGLPWRANVGLRYVETETTSNGFGAELIEILADDPGGATTALVYVLSPEQEIIVKKKYDDVLPSLNFAIDLSDSWVLRAAYAETITRPNTGDIGTARTYIGNLENARLVGGNPDLEPYRTKGFDLSAEWYGEDGSAFSVGVFHKDVEDFISQVITEFDSGFDHPAFGDIIIRDERLQNRPGGELTGFELAGTLLFSRFSDSFWGNFGVSANVTIIDSKDDRANDLVVYPDPQNVKLPSSGLEGFTELAYNVVAFYEDNRLSARLAYNWRDDFMAQRIAGAGLPIHFDDYGALDMSFGWWLTDSVQLRAEAINLLDENTLTYADQRDRTLTNEYTGRRFQVGARFTF